MSAITTHVLDTSRGRPAAGVPVLLELRSGADVWQERGRGITDADGRLPDLLVGPLEAGTYRLTFDTGSYFSGQGLEAFFYPLVTVMFEVRNSGQHHHVPLLLSPFGYSTYRGS